MIAIPFKNNNNKRERLKEPAESLNSYTMASYTCHTYPFTKKALLAIFNRHNPLLSYTTNLKSNIQSDITKDSMFSHKHEHQLTFKRYLEQQFYNVFNNHYDKYENMEINNNLSQDDKYVWSQRQHIVIVDIVIETNNIEFIKCIDTADQSQFQFLTIMKNQLTYGDIVEKIIISFQPSRQQLNQYNPILDEPIDDNSQSNCIKGELNNKVIQSEIINNIVLNNNDDRQHDISHIKKKFFI